jgi:hypothetical protein
MRKDRADVGVNTDQQALRLSQGVAIEQTGPPRCRVSLPPGIDCAERLPIRRPLEDRQAECRLGHEGVCPLRLEAGAGHRQTLLRHKVLVAILTQVVGARVRDHCPRHGQPGIDVEIAGRTVEAGLARPEQRRSIHVFSMTERSQALRERVDRCSWRFAPPQPSEPIERQRALRGAGPTKCWRAYGGERDLPEPPPGLSCSASQERGRSPQMGPFERQSPARQV